MAKARGVGRGASTLGVALWLMAAAACHNDVECALLAADQASYQGNDVQAEQVLRRLSLRLQAAERASRRNAKAAGAASAADAAEPGQGQIRQALHAQVLERLAQLNALQLGNVPQALADYTALAQLPGDPRRTAAALRQVADLLRHRQGQPERAVAVLRQADAALQADPEAQAAVRRDLLATFVDLGNYDAACAQAETLLRGPLTAEQAQDVRLRLGHAQALAGNYQAAAATFLKLVDARPPKAVAALALAEAGHAYQELGEAGQALGYYYAAVHHHPNPLLVQDKIARVRARMYQLERNGSILQPNPASRHALAVNPPRR